MELKRITEVPNRQFTYSYAQPLEYRFCQDSIIFPWWVSTELNGMEIGPDYRALDVCAGCGVVGLELAHYERRIKAFDFLEIQSEFRTSFSKNLEITGRSEFRFLQANYSNLALESARETYDLIVGNPPYFLPKEGVQSPSVVNNRCRFFIDGDFAALILGVANALKPNGYAYLLIKSGREHGRDALRDIAFLLEGQARVDVPVEIRTTTVARIKKTVQQIGSTPPNRKC